VDPLVVRSISELGLLYPAMVSQALVATSRLCSAAYRQWCQRFSIDSHFNVAVPHALSEQRHAWRTCVVATSSPATSGPATGNVVQPGLFNPARRHVKQTPALWLPDDVVLRVPHHAEHRKLCARQTLRVCPAAMVRVSTRIPTIPT
jgi:hypothetical protein